MDHSPSQPSRPRSAGELATLACIWEASAPKPGNVHPGASFPDSCYEDFLLSARAIRSAMDQAVNQRLGQTILQSVKATRAVVNHNTNLGLVLLLAPLASVPADQSLQAGIRDVLSNLVPEDSSDVYEAIRRCQPGGIGKVDKQDIRDGKAPDQLLDAMKQASTWDLIARQYSEGFKQLFDEVHPWIQEGLEKSWTLSASIVHAHVRCMATHPDSLIARKRGVVIALESQQRAQDVLTRGTPGDTSYEQALQDLDQWLRDDGHHRNPGTSADMVGAALFIGLRRGTISEHLSFP